MAGSDVQTHFATLQQTAVTLRQLQMMQVRRDQDVPAMEM
jgi:hypothetical protein